MPLDEGIRMKYEFIFLGTGTSSSLPHIECLTASPDHPPCKTCLSTRFPEGKKNIRRNTSGLLRVWRSDGSFAWALYISRRGTSDWLSTLPQHHSHRRWQKFSSRRPRVVSKVRPQENRWRPHHACSRRWYTNDGLRYQKPADITLISDEWSWWLTRWVRSLPNSLIILLTSLQVGHCMKIFNLTSTYIVLRKHSLRCKERFLIWSQRSLHLAGAMWVQDRRSMEKQC